MKHAVAVGILAHNEESTIETILMDLSKQELLRRVDQRVEVHVVANGCRDGTTTIARGCVGLLEAAGAGRFVVHEVDRADKAAAWNLFVHEAAAGCDRLVLADADIWIDDEAVLSQLVDALDDDKVAVATTCPTKRFAGDWTSPSARLLRRFAPGDANETGICGQLYAGRASVLRAIRLPEGLPAEDGFLRAMVVTDSFRRDEDLSVIRRIDHAHFFMPERSLRGLVHHQTRLVVGGAVNAALYALFRQIRNRPGGAEVDLAAYVARRNGTEWLSQLMMATPNVPVHYLVRRLAGAARAGWRQALERAPITLAGTALDAVAWSRAVVVVRSGRSVGYW